MMKFYGRKAEIKRIREFIDIASKKGSRILVITGRRRIGKTRLALEALKNHKHLYLFTKKKKINEVIDEWSEEIRKKLGNVFYGQFQSLEELLVFLLDYSRKNPMTIVFDEIQDLLYSEPSGFATFQKVFDLNRESSRALLIFLGSSHTLMNKIFKDKKEPLFGRASEIMTVTYLPLKCLGQILADNHLYSGANLLRLFSVFDGIPKYIEEFTDVERGNFKANFKALLTEREFLWEEGGNILKEEFGKESASYYSILSAISRGRRRLNEIEQFTGIKDAGPYLKNLSDLYRLIERKLPVTSRSTNEKNGRYYLRDNFLDFWFHFIESRWSLKEIKKEETAFHEIWEQLPRYEGRKLEDMLIRWMIEENPLNINFSRAGKYWNRKGDVEIDAVFIDENSKRVYIFEVKTNQKKIDGKQLARLREKVALVPDFKGNEIILGTSYIDEAGLQIDLSSP